MQLAYNVTFYAGIAAELHVTVGFCHIITREC